MRAGELKPYKVKVQYPIETQDTAGQLIPSWKTAFECRAAIDPISNREYLSSQHLISDITYIVRIRRRPLSEERISAAWRVVDHRGRIFQLTAPPRPNDADQETQLFCREVF